MTRQAIVTCDGDGCLYAVQVGGRLAGSVQPTLIADELLAMGWSAVATDDRHVLDLCPLCTLTRQAEDD